MSWIWNGAQKRQYNEWYKLKSRRGISRRASRRPIPIPKTAKLLEISAIV